MPMHAPISTPQNVAAKLHAIGAAYLAAHPLDARLEESSGIPAIGTCERITDSAKALVTKRVTRWIDRTYRHEHSDLELTTRFGCVDPDGIVVDVQQDRYGQGSDRLDTGRWWTLRVSDSKIEVLAEIMGSSINDYMEWAEENRTYTTLLADLDGNGTRDALIMTEMHEGGASGSSYSLSVKDSARPARKVLAADAMNVDIIPGKRVVIVTWQRDESAAYSCYEPAGTLGRCEEAKAVERADDAHTIADRWLRITHADVPDRPVLAKALALLDVPADQQAPLLAAVPMGRGR